MVTNKNKFRIFILVITSIFFTVKRDGYFPTGPQAGDFLMAVGNILLLIILASLICIFFQVPDKILKLFTRVINLKIFSKNSGKLLVAFNLFQIFCIAFLHYRTSITFSDLYRIDEVLFGGIVLFSLIITFVTFFLKRTDLALYGLFVSSLLLFIIPVLFFPISAKVSDLLPIIDRQLYSFTHGQNIYQYYLLDNGLYTQAVRQPGTMLSYLPAYLLNIDLRLVSIIYTLGIGIIIARLSFPKIKGIFFNKKIWWGLLLVSVWLLFPYRHLRADLYEPGYWLVLISSLLFLKKEKLSLFSLFWGIGIFMQVWNWLLSPFVSLFLLKKYGLKKSLIYTILYLLVGAIPLLIFILPDPGAYSEHVFGFYNQAIEAGGYPRMTLFLTPFFYLAGIPFLLKYFQIFIGVIIGLLAIKYLKTFNHLIIFFCLVLFAFIQFNIITWTYMYINIFLLMIFYLLVNRNNEEF